MDLYLNIKNDDGESILLMNTMDIPQGMVRAILEEALAMVKGEEDEITPAEEMKKFQPSPWKTVPYYQPTFGGAITHASFTTGKSTLTSVKTEESKDDIDPNNLF